MENYIQIFSHNKKTDKSIVYLKKDEFDIFYSYKYKYPVLVKENITYHTGHTAKNEPTIIRNNIIDPFKQDDSIPKEFQHTIEDYDNAIVYGISMGHNAPAGQHKTNMKIYSDTYLFSNITPQEMVFNCGLWALFENWCKDLQYKKTLYNITIFTGSIPNKTNFKDTNLKTTNLNMNIPQKMFKIIYFQHINKPNISFMEIIMANNEPYYVNFNNNTIDFSPFIVSSWGWFEKFSGINIKFLLEFYKLNIANIQSCKTVISLTYTLSSNLQLLMEKSNWYGYILYSKNIKELEHNWKTFQLISKRFDKLDYYTRYYELVKQKLMKETMGEKIINLFPLSRYQQKQITQ